MSKRPDNRQSLTYISPEARQKALELDDKLKGSKNGDTFKCELVFNLPRETVDAMAFVEEHKYNDYTMFQHFSPIGDIKQLCCINLLDDSKNVQVVRQTKNNRIILF